MVYSLLLLYLASLIIAIFYFFDEFDDTLIDLERCLNSDEELNSNEEKKLRLEKQFLIIFTILVGCLSNYKLSLYTDTDHQSKSKKNFLEEYNLLIKYFKRKEEEFQILEHTMAAHIIDIFSLLKENINSSKFKPEELEPISICRLGSKYIISTEKIKTNQSNTQLQLSKRYILDPFNNIITFGKTELEARTIAIERLRTNLKEDQNNNYELNINIDLEKLESSEILQTEVVSIP